jgi:hypothetical protein
MNEAMESFRRNKFTVIRAGSDSKTISERLIQLSIGGIDVWRRILVPETVTLGELHRIIQTVFGWRSSHNFQFNTETVPGTDDGAAPNGDELSGGMALDISILDLENRSKLELLYEYGTKWTVRLMILSRNETPGSKPVRCVAGAGAAPPEFISGPLRFRKVVSALENGNDMERLGARQELGSNFNPGDFDIDACNRNLAANFPGREHRPEH